MADTAHTYTDVAHLVTGQAWRLEQAIRRALVGTDLTVEQWWILHHLAGTDAATMSDLVRAAHAPAPTVTRLVDKLVENALAYRTLDGLDRRRVLVRLGPRGLAVHDELAPAVDDAVRAHLDHLHHWQVEALEDLLQGS